ncbi:hypothetical protein TNCV_1692111 [Trichonephila clavipes]|nr:hypothetical protein TNCV_1692111 [Trichonephila clavipes]
MTRSRVENREGSLGYPGFVKPVFTKGSRGLSSGYSNGLQIGRAGFDARCYHIPSEYTRIPCLNCGGGDRRYHHQSSLQEFRRANSYCHLYGAQGQRQAYSYPLAMMNFVGLVLITSDRWH